MKFPTNMAIRDFVRSGGFSLGILIGLFLGLATDWSDAPWWQKGSLIVLMVVALLSLLIVLGEWIMLRRANISDEAEDSGT